MSHSAITAAVTDQTNHSYIVRSSNEHLFSWFLREDACCQSQVDHRDDPSSNGEVEKLIINRFDWAVFGLDLGWRDGHLWLWRLHRVESDVSSDGASRGLDVNSGS